jgi:hypothetical protein
VAQSSSGIAVVSPSMAHQPFDLVFPPTHINNLVVMHASITALGQLTRGDHRQTHHCQLIQSICNALKKVPMLAQAVMDQIYQTINRTSNAAFFGPMNEHDKDSEEALDGKHDDEFDTIPTSNDSAENTTNNQTVRWAQLIHDFSHLCLISPVKWPAGDNKWF